MTAPTGPTAARKPRKPPPAPACDNPVCGQPCDGPRTPQIFEVSQPGRGPWHLCSLPCLVTWGRLWTVRLDHELHPEHAEAERP